MDVQLLKNNKIKNKRLISGKIYYFYISYRIVFLLKESQKAYNKKSTKNNI